MNHASLTKTRSIVQLELNEISPVLIKKLVNDGKLPNFKIVVDTWFEAKTTSEEKYEHIEPWIQWVTAHTGKSFQDHGIFRLGDAHELKHRQIWEELSLRDIPCAVIGAMNATPGEQKDGIFFPDPWSKENSTHPEELKSLWSLISSRVQSHAAAQPSLSDVFSALKVAKKFKISPRLLLRIGKQVVAQRLDPKVKWKLVGLFDLFLAEIFSTVLTSKKYRFMSLFLNSVAHYQHHFWRNLEPSKFSQDVTAPDCRAGDNPLLYGYEVMDEVLGRVLADVNLDECLVLIVSGLSQIPDVRFENQGGMNYYRLINHKSFAGLFGVEPHEVFPLMSRDWQIRVHHDRKELIKSKLGTVMVSSDQLFRITEDTDGYLFIETAVTRVVADTEPVSFGDKLVGTFHDLFTRTAVKSGHHTGIGVLWASQNLGSLGIEKTIPLTKVFDIPCQILN